MAIVYKNYSNEYSKQVIELLSHLWKNEYEIREKKFRWKHEIKFEIYSLSFIALTGEKVIGFRGYIIQPFYLEGKKVVVAFLADAVVHPNYRGHSIFKELTKYSLSELENKNIQYILALSSNKYSTGGYLKLGWQPFAQKNLFYHFNFSKLLKSKIFNNNVGSFKKFHCGDCNEDINIDDKTMLRINNKLMSSDVALLSSNLCHNSKLRGIKSKDYYEWRYNNPEGNYLFFYLIFEYKTVAFMAINVTSPFYFNIIEFLYSDIKYLNICLKKILKLFKPIYYSVWQFSQGKECKKVFIKNGFISVNLITKRIARFVHPPALIRPSKLTFIENDWFYEGLDMRAENSWLIHKIDSDAD